LALFAISSRPPDLRNRNVYKRFEFHLPVGAARMRLVETLEMLSQARRYVAEGEEFVTEQRRIVDRLEQRGRDPLEAILALEQLEGMQDEYIAHLDRLNQQVMGILKQD
jgi:hypothetical protein